MDKALEGKFDEAIDIWTSMQEPGARIYFNIASMYILLGSLDSAEKVGQRYCHWFLILGQWYSGAELGFVYSEGQSFSFGILSKRLHSPSEETVSEDL